MSKKKPALRQNLARLTALLSALMLLSFLAPYMAAPTAGGPAAFSGLDILRGGRLMKLLPMALAACAALALSLLTLLTRKKPLAVAAALALAAGLISAMAALFTAKETADASQLLSEPFLVRFLSAGFWLYLVLALAALLCAVAAMREPGEYVVLSIMACVWLLPILWLVLTAFRQEAGAYTPYLLPKGYTAANFTRLFTETRQFNFPRWYLNTLVVAVFTCAITTTLVLMISYTFSRLRFPARRALMNIGLILGMFPGFMSMIAIYHILKAIGLAKSLVSLVLVYSAGGVLNYFIAKGFFDTIPRSLDEAATIDGASRNTIFWKIILPSSQPIVVYTAITAFIAPWIDFIFVSVIMKDDYQSYTVALGLFKMLEREHVYEYFTRFCAGAVLVAIPITLLFVRIQKFYVEGVTGGAVKG